MEFKDKIIYVRAKLKISQDKLAKELGVSFSTVNRWENGNTTPHKTAVINFYEFCMKKQIILKDYK